MLRGWLLHRRSSTRRNGPDKEGYLSGWVMSEYEEYGDVMVVPGSEVSSLDLFLLWFTHRAFICCADVPRAPVCSLKDESAQIR